MEAEFVRSADAEHYVPTSWFGHMFGRLKTRVAYGVWRRKVRAYVMGRDRIRVLELGSGPGYFLEAFRRWYPDAMLAGSDHDAELLAFARRQVPTVPLIRMDAHRIACANDSLDVVVCLQTIEHVADPDQVLAEVYHVLGAGGLLILTTPNPSGMCARWLKEKWASYRDDHVSLRSPAEWRRAIRDAGFTIEEIGTTGLTGFPLLRRFPLALVNWIPMAILGYFGWMQGESLAVIATKPRKVWREGDRGRRGAAAGCMHLLLT